MKYFDAFSGYGGFSLGIQQAYEDRVRGWDWQAEKGDGEPDSPIESLQTAEADSQRPGNPSSNIKFGNIGEVSCIGFSEIDKYAIQIYQKHFPEHKNYGDITKINAEELPDFDLFTGGFPCQAFSIAGKRKGFDDTRGTLFFDIARILRAKRPRLLLLENVKGLLSHDNGKTFSTIISTLDEIGYDLQWQVLNAKHFGVPQNRERVFIIGHLGGFGGRQVFPIGTGNELDSQSDGQGDEVAYCLQAGGDKHRGSYVRAVLTPDRLEKRQNGRRIKENGEPSFTLTGQDKHGVFDGEKIRRLTPTECERLMGLPDGWTEGVSDTQRYKLCGNGVVVNVVEEIIKSIIK